MNNILQTQDLSKVYNGITRVDGLNLLVEEGKIYGLLGPNGAGKTTTLKMLLGLAKPSSGHIKIFDKEFSENKEEIIKDIGCLIESPSFYEHLTGLENLQIQELLLDLPEGSAEAALRLVGLSQDQNRKVKEYSLGMQQRLGIAIALVRKPKLLILDEPTNGLDPAGIQALRDLLQKLSKINRITIIISSHLLSEIEKLVDTVGIINQGKLIYQGDIKTLQSLKPSSTSLDTSDNKKAQALLSKFNPQLNEKLILNDLNRQDRADIMKYLVNHNLDIYELSTSEPDLEDLFLSITNQGKNHEYLSENSQDRI